MVSSHSQSSLDPAIPKWRSKLGYMGLGGSQFESIQILFGRFLADRFSPNPFSEQALNEHNPSFEWGQGEPFEKVIDSQEAFEHLMANPHLFRNAIAILEPWEHVGKNLRNEDVRASINVAYLTQAIADCDSILFPLWHSGLLDPQKLISVISSGLAIVMEGGDPSATRLRLLDLTVPMPN